jgi:carboxyl-terminal processing protease
MSTTRLVLATALFALVVCDDSSREESDDASPRDGASPLPIDADEDAAAPPPTAAPKSQPPPARTMPSARAGFDEVAALLRDRYVDGPLGEDELWTAATEGVLARLRQLEAHPVNTLLSPEEMAEIHSGIAGKLAGIGVVIEMVADVVVVRDLVAGGPAERAGLQPGDRILGIGGERLRGGGIAAAVGRIRGPAGTEAELFVQRDTEEWNVTVTRGEVEIPSVEERALASGVGYLRIGGMGKHTAAQLDAALDRLRNDGARMLVMDLRGSPGGLFDAAIEVAQRFLPAGAGIVTVRDRDGGEQRHLAPANGSWVGVPLVVLVDRETSSGAEVVAAALGEQGGARLVGEPTLGKSTIEMVHPLANGWGVKLSEKTFVAPSGKSFVGGLQPHLRIPASLDKRQAVARIDAAADAPLAAALELLEEG